MLLSFIIDAFIATDPAAVIKGDFVKKEEYFAAAPLCTYLTGLISYSFLDIMIISFGHIKNLILRQPYFQNLLFKS